MEQEGAGEEGNKVVGKDLNEVGEEGQEQAE